MARNGKADMEKVGNETFDMIYQVGARPPFFHYSQTPKPAVFTHIIPQFPPRKVEASVVMDSNQAARAYGGVVLEGFPPVVLDSNQAARAYGGVVLDGFSPVVMDSNQAARAYGWVALEGFPRHKKPGRFFF